MTDKRAEFTTIILAAGKGSRMRSSLPKPLHLLGGKPMISWVIDAADAAGAAHTVVVVPGDDDRVPDYLRDRHRNGRPSAVVAVVQPEPLGTGDAVLQCRDALAGKEGVAVIAFADTPLVSVGLFHALADSVLKDGHDICCLGFETQAPQGYGRLIFDGMDRLVEIIEEKDTDAESRDIRLVNSGLIAARVPLVFDLLEAVGESGSGEKYLTGIVAAAQSQNLGVGCVFADETEVMGVNTHADLAEAERVIQARLRQKAMLEGVTLIAPETVFLHADAVIEPDVVIHPHVVIGGGVHIAGGAEIKSFSHLEGAHIGPCAVIGPYARLRPGTRLSEGVRIGNFVETKNITMGAMAKANHLTYLGDADIGESANIGAGTITCNYDGSVKSKTRIGARAFIGSNTALVAPMEVGDGAMIGAGSTITDDVDADALAVERSETRMIAGGAGAYRRRNKDKTRE